MKDKKQYYVFEPIARTTVQPEDHDYQLQEALEQLSLTIEDLNLRISELETKVAGLTP